MYKEFFSFTRKPFALFPDPDFLFLGKSHRKARMLIEHAIRERAGFILLTGEAGAGKTTMIRDLIKNCDSEMVLAKIFNTRIGPEDLLFILNDDFGLPVQHTDKKILLRDLNEFLIAQFAQGKRPLLIIDEAQNLSSETLEEVRLLSNLETDNAKLLQILLVGQPELRQTIALPELTNLRQRISIYCHVSPLEKEELHEYIACRMEVAGNRHAVTLTPQALAVIWRSSRGIPRLVNIICDFILLFAYTESKTEIDLELAETVVSELDFDANYWNPPASAIDETLFAKTGEKASMSNMTQAVQQISSRVEALETSIHTNAEKLEAACRRINSFEHILHTVVPQGAMGIRGTEP